jgi:LAO/AO transport system kinase
MISREINFWYKGVRTMELVERMLKGDRLALAKLITLVENRSSEISQIMTCLYPHTGKAHVIGITGSPGVGKSSLVDKLIALLRKRDVKIGVIAVDPSSPFSGGALLGDRIRMQSHSTDPGVFIRSMACRGHLGGLAFATQDTTLLLDAFGYEVILIETVGVGQSEVSIAQAADTTLLVTMPSTGDTIQVMKAGIMEIGDIFVVNKADQEGADKTVIELESMLMLGYQSRDWIPPIVRTVATNGDGIEELWDKIQEHQKFLSQHSRLKERRLAQIKGEIHNIITEKVEKKIWDGLMTDTRFMELLEKVGSRELDPYTAADSLWEALK